MIRELSTATAIVATPNLTAAITQEPTLSSVLIEAVRQAPSMGILVLVVYLFLRSMQARDKQVEEAIREVTKVLGDLREDLARKGKA